MSAAVIPNSPDRTTSRRLFWAAMVVLAIATLLRAWNIAEWSMWEDEEGSITLAQKPFVGFQGFFPIFFVALNWVLTLTGNSVGAARALAAALGLLSVG